MVLKHCIGNANQFFGNYRIGNGPSFEAVDLERVRQAHLYVLRNSADVAPYVEEHLFLLWPPSDTSYLYMPHWRSRLRKHSSVNSSVAASLRPATSLPLSLDFRAASSSMCEFLGHPSITTYLCMPHWRSRLRKNSSVNSSVVASLRPAASLPLSLDLRAASSSMCEFLVLYSSGCSANFSFSQSKVF
ncbi:hypothetical protein ACFE04_030671 [Oxalis oulophora]